MGGEVSRARYPGRGKTLRREAPAVSGQSAPTNARESVLPLAVRQQLWDQLWRQLLTPVPVANQDDADGMEQ